MTANSFTHHLLAGQVLNLPLFSALIHEDSITIVMPTGAVTLLRMSNDCKNLILKKNVVTI